LPEFRVRRKLLQVTGFRVFGLTGGIGSGKSTVAALVRARGLPVVSADELAREAVLPGSPGLAEVEASFGRGVMNRDGTLDRRALGDLIFRSPASRAKLNGVLHPLIQSLAQKRFDEAREAGQALVCYDIPLLFESGAVGRYRPVVVVYAPRNERAKRVAERDGLSALEFEQRDQSQISLEEKVQRADFVVDNSRGPADLEKQVEALIPQIAAFELQ
jgi:dephospho-CoA kinase